MFKRLRHLLRRSPFQYDGGDFSVRVETIGREEARIIYTRDGHTFDLLAGFYGGVSATIAVTIPRGTPANRVGQMVQDLSEGFAKLGFGYEIIRKGEPESVPEDEHRQALAELSSMGYSVSADGSGAKVTGRPNLKPASKEAFVAETTRFLKLARAASGKRVPVEVLASAKPPED